MHPLRNYLDQTGQTLEAFGERAGLSAPSLSRIISRKQVPSLEAVARIIRATGGNLTADHFLATPPSRSRTRARQGAEAA